MTWMTALPLAVKAAILGVVEGITEFLPVSSTGHLIVAGDWLGWTGDDAKTFEIFIQLGAILAVVWIYRDRLLAEARGFGRDPASNAFAASLFIAFLPAAVIGLLLNHWITAHLFSTQVVAWAFLVGGVLILIIERFHPTPTVTDASAVPARASLGVGMAQVLSLIPGTSRSAATILGGYSLGLTRVAATEFSFFLAIPVMFAATLYELWKGRHGLSGVDVAPFAVGFLTAFASAVVVVRAFLKYVSGHSFTAFAWYRIAFAAFLLWLYR
ncbi:MAG TPA: undecaprenyl-diphosphate phosphatase [Gemmatimonadales bacterium]|nr:undecaprenyl-diphosphate phosphatase [Gemmatimonadales bacterium]